MISAYWSMLANHLWQSTVFAVLIAALALLLRRHGARLRFCLWFVASLKFLIPFAILVSLGTYLEWRPALDAKSFSLPSAIGEISRPFESVAPFNPAIPPASNPAPIVLFVIWVSGALVSAIGWLRAWLRVEAALRASSIWQLPATLSAPIKAVCTPVRIEPGVVGLFRPVLMLPNGISEQLTAQELDAVLLHEMCHIRWRDNLTAFIHLVETLFWFYPPVWWIGKRAMVERERACDEEVLRMGSRPEVYAQGILNVCRLYKVSPLACASGVTGSNLKERIEAIMRNERPAAMTTAGKLFLGITTVFVVAAPIGAGALPPRFSQSITLSIDGPSFEVASVKPNGPEQLRRGKNVSLDSGPFVEGIKRCDGLSAWRMLREQFSRRFRFRVNGFPAVRNGSIKTVSLSKQPPAGLLPRPRWRGCCVVCCLNDSA